MSTGEAVYIVIVGDDDRIHARRYVDCDRLAEWLQRNGPDAARCEVYTDAPEKGGHRLAILRRNAQHEWSAFEGRADDCRE